MKAIVKAPRNKDCRDFVSQLDMTAGKENQVDQMKLALIAAAMFPVGPEHRDKMFDRWLITRIRAYCKANNVHIERSKT